MDHWLTWNTHISHVMKKYNDKLELVKRAKPYLTPKLLLLLYNSIAKPTLEYCCSSWTCNICPKTCREDSSKRWLHYPINNIIQINQLYPNSWHHSPQDPTIQTFKCIYDISPPCLSTLMEKPTHHHSTRAIANNNVNIPKARSNAGKRRFSFMASTLWNSFPNEAKKISSQPYISVY
jgi:hypothetical protein